MTRHATPGVNRSAPLAASSRPTLATTAAKPVGLVGKAPVVSSVVTVPSGEADRLLLAAYRSLPYMPQEIRGEVAALLTPRAMAVLAGAGVVWAGSQFFGAGELFDVVVGGVTAATIGWDGIKSLRGFYSFYRLASQAKTDAEIDTAAHCFATAVLAAIAAIGWTGLSKWLGKGKTGIAAFETDAAKLARWEKFISGIKFEVPRDQGMLWSKLSALEEIWKAQLKAKGISASEMQAEKEGLTCLEAILRKNGFFELYARDFGETFHRKIWEELSVRYVQSLQGKVTGWVTRPQFYQHLDETAALKLMKELNINASPKTAVMLARNLFSERFHELKKLASDSSFVDRPDPVITREIEELIKIMETNGKITAIEIKDVSSGETFGYWTQEIVQSLKRLEAQSPR